MSPRAYVMQGDSFSANVFLGAFNTKVSPIMYVGEYDTSLFNQTGEVKFIGEYDSIEVKNGIGNYKAYASQAGNKSWKGIIKVPHPNPKKQGVYLYYPFENQYTLAQPSANVALTKMNTVYVGLDNPLDISVPGIAKDKIRATFNKGSLIPGTNGEYKVIPTSHGRGVITVDAEISPDQYQKMGTLDVIIRKLPKPDANIPVLTNSKVPSSHFGAVKEVRAVYPEAFIYEARCEVVGFKLEVSKNGNIEPEISNRGGKIAQGSPVYNRLQNIQRGSTVTFKNIKAKGPDGIVHELKDLIYTVR